jgi:hypothetical protein
MALADTPFTRYAAVPKYGLAMLRVLANFGQG